jgi:hypothetical protein
MLALNRSENSDLRFAGLIDKRSGSKRDKYLAIIGGFLR